MYKTILVPLDGSQRAEAILPHVESLARCTGAQIILLSIVDPPMNLVTPYDIMPNYMADEIQAMVDDGKAYLDEVAKTLRAKGLQVRTAVEYGAVVASIIEVAEREKADLLAMASHGRTGLSRVFYGSVAAGVLQRVDRPLLLIRA